MKLINLSAHNIARGGSLTLLLSIISDLEKLGYNLNILVSPENYENTLFSHSLSKGHKLYKLPIFLTKFYMKLFLNYIYLPLFWRFYGGRALIFNIGNIAFPSFSKQVLLLHNAYPFYIKRLFELNSYKLFDKLIAILMAVFIRFNLTFANVILVQTLVMKNFVKSIGYNSEVFPNFVADDFVNESGQFSKNPTKILLISSYYFHKNFEVYLMAAKILVNSNIEFYITLDENNPHDKNYLNYIKSKKIMNIHNLGKINPHDIHMCCDILVNPSFIESFSTTYLEAFKYSKPLIASDYAFSREICDDAALYFDPNNALSLVDSICSLIDSEELRLLLVRNGKRRLKFYQTIKENYQFLNEIS